MATFGVGPSAARTNTGPNTGMKSRLGSLGKVYNDGVLVFDPTVDAVELIQSDTYSQNYGSYAVTSVVVTLPSSKTRAVYTIAQSAVPAGTREWLNELVASNKTLAGSVKVGTDAAINAETVTLTKASSNFVIQFDMATDISKNQAAFDSAGSVGRIQEADGENASFTKAAA